MAWNNNSGGPGAAAVAVAAAAAAAALGAAAAAIAAAVAAVRHRRPPDMEDVIRKGQERLRNLMPGGLGSFKGILLIALAAVVIWLVTGFFRVQPNQQAIQLIFGKPYGGAGRARACTTTCPARSAAWWWSNVQDQRRTVIGSRGARPQPVRRGPRATSTGEPDADRRREHRRHRVRGAVADQGRVQVRLRRAQSARRTCAPPPRPRCAR